MFSLYRTSGRAEKSEALRRRGQLGLILGMRGNQAGLGRMVDTPWVAVDIRIDDEIVDDTASTLTGPRWYPLSSGKHVVEVLPVLAEATPLRCSFEVTSGPVVVAVWPRQSWLGDWQEARIEVRHDLGNDRWRH